MEAPHHMAIRELDLSAYHPNPLVDRVNAMPGLKTSAGRHPFFPFLSVIIVFCCVFCFIRLSVNTAVARYEPRGPVT